MQGAMIFEACRRLTDWLNCYSVTTINIFIFMPFLSFLDKILKTKRRKVPCLCCGYKTIDEGEAGLWDICPVCFWEHDTLLKDVDRPGLANKTSLRQAQKNFLEFGACDIDMKKNVRKPKPSEKRDDGWQPFPAMQYET